MSYSGLNRAQLSYEYLHTNSTTHEFLFGALAELVDNSRDAGASKLEIFTVADTSLRGGCMLCFQDDGEGMDPKEAAHVITFGRSVKRGVDSNLIGQYGNGLKSGSMRIGNDVIAFTKKKTTMTALMLSRTFHEDEKIEEVIVPLPSFQSQNFQPLYDEDRKGKERHDMEMDLILKYSPFHSRDEFFAQFKRLTEDSGTLIVVYNLKLLDNGETELDFKSNPFDICLAGTDPVTDRRLVSERYSFRAYTAILYLEPRMKVYIQGKKVHSRRYVYTLYKPRCYQYSSARFKSRSKDDVKKAELAAKVALAKLKEAESKARDLEKKFIATPTNKDMRAKLRAAQKSLADLQEESKTKQIIALRKKKQLSVPKTLTFVFGINLENRHFDGLFIYNCCRLIKMYEKSGPQLDDGSAGRGVVGVVNIPYIVLEPTHNKQDFADGKEYRHLLKALGDHMDQYWRDINIDNNGTSTTAKFWEGFGYLTTNWTDPPSNEIKYQRKRAMQTSICLQCDSCLKWRILPFSADNIGKQFPDDWVCSMNPDTSHNRCSIVEEKMTIPEGHLQKVEKSKAEKEDVLIEEISKLKGKLEKVQQTERVMSSRELNDAMTRAASSRQRTQVRPPPLPPSPPPRNVKAEVASRSRQNARATRPSSPAQPPPLPPTPPVRNASAKAELLIKTKSLPPRAAQVKSPATLQSPPLPPTPPVRNASAKAELLIKTKSLPARTAPAKSPPTVQSRGRGKWGRKDSVESNVEALLGEEEDEDEEEEEEEEEEDDEEDDDDEEEEEEQSTRSKRKEHKPAKPAKSISRATTDRGAKRKAAQIQEEQRAVAKKRKEDAPVIPKIVKQEDTPKPRRESQDTAVVETPKPRRVSVDVAETPSRPLTNRKSLTEAIKEKETDEWPDSESDNDEVSFRKYEIGAKVIARVKTKWYCGTVIKVKASANNILVKFEKYPDDKYDKWLSSTEVVVYTPQNSTSLPSPAASDAGHEVPSSSTSAVGNENQIYEDITRGYRTCLHYFLPPNWTMDKDTVNSLGPQELSSFPIDDFFDHYEKGLRKLVSGFQVEAATYQKEAEKSKASLKHTSRLIARLLNSIHEECNLDPDTDLDKVDELLQACVQQAEMASSTADQVTTSST